MMAKEFQVKGTLEVLIKKAIRIDVLNSKSKFAKLNYTIYPTENLMKVKICQPKKK